MTRKTNRRYILWVLLAAYVFLLGGISGIEPAEKSGLLNSGERFPCENCPCGCSTAEFCWDQCCCHSDSEKIAWAEANDVTPPAFLSARVAKSSSIIASEPKFGDAPACKSCCCSAKPKKVAAPKKANEAKTAAKPATTSVVLFWKAAQCRGVQSFWKLLSIAVVVNESKETLTARVRSTGLVLADESADSPAYAPTPPVPWSRAL
ncbi:hypothetical protein [Rubripirellula obstinata]|uniref:hypothetical protein n=1 Tax=Rubripirellula obstinata TaxID=406547 RepID=UPI0008319C8D|nr:hypothetical protein [Rubripirellula obstinata]